MKRLLSMTMVLVLLLLSVTGCGGGSGSSSVESAGSSPSSADSSQEEAINEVSYPIIEDNSITLTCWMPLNAGAAKYVTSMDENPAFEEYQKRTGIDIQFIHPAPGQEKEQFSLLIASNNLPDILYFPQAYSGGEFQGMRDGMFVDLTDRLPTLAPDYYRIIMEDDEFFREISDNEGHITAFHDYKPQGDPPARRMILKEDTLSELGVGIPETLDDYETMFDKMLTAGLTPYLPIKSINGVEVQFAGMFGIYAESTDADGLKFSKDGDGTIKLGHIEPEFKEYLSLMNSWYNKGYISKDFTSVDEQQANTLFDTGAVGLVTSAVVASYNRTQSQGFAVVSTPYPRLKKGDKLHYLNEGIWPSINRMETTAAITKDCKYVDEAIQFMNYAYTQEGADLLNWGVEGVNWEWQDGQRVYNDTMLDNPMFGTEEASYIYKAHFAPKLTYPDTECHANLLKSPGALAIRFKWADDPDLDSVFVLPPFQLSEDAQARRAEIMTDVTTYCNEMVLKFIIGTEPLENFDQYVETVKSMGVDEAIQLTQEAYDAYISKNIN